MFKRYYSLKKSFSILTKMCALQKSSPLPLSMQKNCLALQEAILKKERIEADHFAREAENFLKAHPQKNWIKNTFEFILALCVAFFIATLIRQTWFELYQIPTGSMRPTYEELDHLIVSKSAFGINAPFTTGSLYFDPNAVQRGGAVIFSSSGLDLSHTDSHYFWLFPYKKRFIKRMIGLPGDTLYFYGGQIYSIDRDGHPVTELRTHHEMQNLEYIPFRSFLGEIKRQKATTPSFDFWAIFSLAGQELGRGKIGNGHFFDPEIMPDKQWVAEGAQGRYYKQFYGIENYGMARLLDKEQVQKFYAPPAKQAPLYLEIRHDPTLKDPSPQIVKGPFYGSLLTSAAQTSLMPLGNEEIEALFKNLYTTRFTIKGGHAHNYAYEEVSAQEGPSFADVPDGTYEFYYGKGYRVGWGGLLFDLSAEHPLYQKTAKNLQRLFNLGIDFSTYMEPKAPLQALYPSRYAYFRQGDLYVMGLPFLKKGSAALEEFEKEESKKGERAFKDLGEPSVEKIKRYGLKVPDKHYFVLGDNHAVSGDSRVFGFVPEENLEGVPTFLIWPFGPRWGWATHRHYPWITESNLVIWGIFALGCFLYWQWGRYRMSRRIFY